MVEQLFATLVLAVCVAMLARLMLGRQRRRRVDAVVLRVWVVCSDAARRAFHWRSSRREAAAAAEDAIRRARGTVDRDGNVIRPRSFRGPRKPH